VSPTTETIDLETASPAQIRRFLRPAPQRRTVTRRSTEGADLGGVELEPSIFGIEPNLAVLHQVVTAQLAAARAGTQSTKTRAEVRGGGAKPFRQKGTGRARQGSTRSPQWVGGGVALGPKPRSYAQHTPKKMVQLALRSALSDRASQGRVALVDAWPFDIPSTKAALAALSALDLSGRVLVVLGDEDGYADRSFGNLQEVQTILTGELNAYDILVNDWVVFTDETLPGGAGPGPGTAAPDSGTAGATEPEPETTATATAGDATATDAPTAAMADATDAAGTDDEEGSES
jgi:large subunit ribosomal protein L4